MLSNVFNHMEFLGAILMSAELLTITNLESSPMTLFQFLTEVKHLLPLELLTSILNVSVLFFLDTFCLFFLLRYFNDIKMIDG